MNSEYKIITKIQITSVVPYKVIAEYPFLYHPLGDGKLIIDDETYGVDNMFDRIDVNGNITRHIRYFQLR